MGLLQDDDVGDIGTVPVCRACGSERVARDAWACWNPQTGLWELETVFDQEWCHACEAETRFVWKRAVDGPRAATRDLNDRLRRDGIGNGTVVITRGVQVKGDAFVDKAVAAVRAFDRFNDANDPWGEHDFGRFELDDQVFLWKIDYYDRDYHMGSDDPCDPDQTRRVLTVLLAEEY